MTCREHETCLWCQTPGPINQFGACWRCHEAALRAIRAQCDIWDWAIRGALILCISAVVGVFVWMVWP